ncbi:MAG: hypothetical protein ACRD2L_14370 [Terriglobia bacterium]
MTLYLLRSANGQLGLTPNKPESEVAYVAETLEDAHRFIDAELLHEHGYKRFTITFDTVVGERDFTIEGLSLEQFAKTPLVAIVQAKLREEIEAQTN